MTAREVLEQILREVGPPARLDLEHKDGPRVVLPGAAAEAFAQVVAHSGTLHVGGRHQRTAGASSELRRLLARLLAATAWYNNERFPLD